MKTRRRFLALMIVVLAAMLLGCLLVQLWSRHAPEGDSLQADRRATSEEALTALDPEPSRKERESLALGKIAVAGTPNSFRVKVVEQVGLPVEGARVAVLSGPAHLHAHSGLTDSEGFLSFTLPVSFPCEFQVSSRGYVATRLALDSPPQDTVVVTLFNSASIIGHVLGLPVGEASSDVRVLLYPTSLARMPFDELDRLGRGLATGAFSAPVSPDGRFVVEDVNPQHTYGAIAAGSSLASMEARTGIAPGEVNLELVVAPVYGVSVVLEGDDAETTRRISLLGLPLQSPLNAKPADAFRVLLPSFVPVLGRWQDRPDYNSLSRSTCIYIAKRETEVLATFTYKLEMPGFSPIREAVEIRRVNGLIPEHKIILRSSEKDLSACRVTLELAAIVGSGDIQYLGGPGYLEFRRIEPSGWPADAALIMPIKSGLLSPFECHIPFGGYDIRYRNSNTGADAPSKSQPAFRLAAYSESSNAHLDLTSMGAVLLRLRDANGNQMSGMLSLELTRKAEGSNEVVDMNVLMLPDAPYRIAPVHSGQLTIKVRSHASRGRVNQLLELNVLEGQLTEVDVILQQTEHPVWGKTR